MRYALRDHGLPWKVITVGRKTVGRVGTHAEGGFVGTIGKDTVRAATEAEAFELVAARAMGYANAGELRARNAAVRARNRANKAKAREAVDAMLSGDFERFADLLEMPNKGAKR